MAQFHRAYSNFICQGDYIYAMMHRDIGIELALISPQSCSNSTQRQTYIIHSSRKFYRLTRNPHSLLIGDVFLCSSARTRGANTGARMVTSEFHVAPTRVAQSRSFLERVLLWQRMSLEPLRDRVFPVTDGDRAYRPTQILQNVVYSGPYTGTRIGLFAMANLRVP